jgi:hypothetical protein
MDLGEIWSCVQMLGRRLATVIDVFRGSDPYLRSNANMGKYILKGSDDGVMHFEESCFWTLTIVQCFFL